MIDSNMAESLTPEEPSTRPASSRLLAPAWHTALVVLLAAASSVAGVVSAKHGVVGKGSNLPTYLASIALEWTLAAVVWWGLHLRGTHLHEVLGKSIDGLKEWFVDAGIALVFWLVALTVLGLLAMLMQPLHLHPEKIRDTVTKLAPDTAVQLLAWGVLSISAGVCEEFLFRGYLQLQFARISRHTWVGVFASAMVFGFSHGYEGWSGMLLIVAFGALFSLLRLLRGNTRAGMMAHAWHDFFSGMMLYALAHSKLVL